MKAPGDRFFVLDGLRGVAAVAVMLFHFFPAMPGGLFGRGYLAVDFFFLLSGFVIAYNYDRKFEHGLSVRRFALIRAIRLYPLPVAAVGAAALLQLGYPHPTLPTERFTYTMVMNLLLLPNTLTGTADRFPFDPPSWSLFYELLVNVAYAIVIPVLGRRVLMGLTVVLGLALMFATVRCGSVNLLYLNVALGLLRTAFSFSFGVLLARSGVPTGPVPAWALYALLLLAIGAPRWLAPGPLYELAAITVIFPLIVRLGAGKGRPRGAAVEQELGELSYPVYVLHMPLLSYVGVGVGHFVHDARAIPVAATLVVLVAAAVSWRYYDRPVRVWLSRKLLAR